MRMAIGSLPGFWKFFRTLPWSASKGMRRNTNRVKPRSEIRVPVAYHEIGDMVYLLIVPFLMSFSFLIQDAWTESKFAWVASLAASNMHVDISATFVLLSVHLGPVSGPNLAWDRAFRVSDLADSCLFPCFRCLDGIAQYVTWCAWYFFVHNRNQTISKNSLLFNTHIYHVLTSAWNYVSLQTNTLCSCIDIRFAHVELIRKSKRSFQSFSSNSLAYMNG